MRYRYSLVLMILAVAACGGGSGGGSAGGTAVAGGAATGGSGSSAGSGSGGSTTGGGAFGFDTGIGGSGGIIGEIDEFGSIILNGLEMNTDDAAFFVDGAGGFQQSDLREGQYVVVVGELGERRADSVHYRANLKGPVSMPPVAIDAETGRYELTVLGQTVITSAATRMDGVSVDDIQQGELLEVSGPLDSAGRVLATYVHLHASLTAYKATGRVEDLDELAQTFRLGGLAVSYSGAAFLRFAQPVLTDGQLVEVRVAPADFTAPGSVSVSEVERLPVPKLGDGAEVEVKGLIDTFVSAAELSVAGLPVRTDAHTTYERGGAEQLGLNVEVEVEGTANVEGVILADKVVFERSIALRVEGVTSEVNVVEKTVTALGVTFAVDGATRLNDQRDRVMPFTLNDLMPGDLIRSRGFLEGTVPVAVEITRYAPNTGADRTLLRGPLTGFDKAAGTVEIQHVTVVDGIGTTTYEDPEEQSVDRDAFYDTLLPGAEELNVTWDDFGSLADPADRLRVEDD